MRNELLIYHRGLKGSENSPFLNEPGLVRWTTCVRSLLIGVSESETGQNYDTVYQGPDAVQFLAEIVAGLQSPMLGETEVHGQFKDLLSETENMMSPDLYMQLMGVHFLARKVRSDFLKNLGCQSYGSFARKKMKEISDVSILGAGQLASEILPWLAKTRENIHLVSRNPDRVASEFLRFSNLNITNYENMPTENQGLVITAPLRAQDLHSYWSNDNPTLTLDFRAESRHDPLDARFNAISLDAVFGEIERQKTQVEAQVQNAKSFIQNSSHDLDSVVGRALKSIKVS